jgi:hypothetical protein
MDSSTAARTFGLLVLGGLAFLGVYWQIRTIRNDIANLRRMKLPTRIKIGIAICILLVVGIVVRDVIAIHFDPRSYFTYALMVSDLETAMSFSLLFLVELYFGPVITTGALIMTAYFFFEHQEVYVLPLVQSTVDMLASVGPAWTQNAYTVILGTYTVVTSFKDAVA